MKLITTKTLILASAVALTFTACKKDETSDADSDKVTAVDNQAADDLSTDVIDQFNMVTMNQMAIANSAPGKAVEATVNEDARTTSGSVTISPVDYATFPKTITINFGTGTVDKYGVVRKGKIVGVLSNHWWISGAELRIDMQDYYVNGIQVKGTKILTSNGFNAETNSFSYNVSVDRARINEEGNSFTWSATRTVSYFTKGTNTALDDYITVTGSTSGTNRKGKAFTTTIIQELKKPVISRWIVSGIIEHKVADRPTVTLDYGDGTIDNKAKVTVGDATVEITLHK
ncbi:hypothetical protein C3K47_10890 [Solitalea longa]|uniref:Lipoprotein n=1 Tax=Solitalea longa TaxID=2079460 RepID=A0A2S5A2C5_9SPHI|nr:hypothetical protein [Solitalea longa]POY36253.1 hypothetical protein C3K47_10890 [Solitalea longa]